MMQWPKQFKHALGQNFLRDDRVLESILELINPQAEDNMLEIGAGIGVLTCRLLPKLNHLSVVEIDESLLPLLRENCQSWLERLTIFQQDILGFALDELGDQLRVVGNLPYNISTPLIFHLLNYPRQIKDMHFMLQKEVGERLAARPGGAAYGRLSVMAQYYCRIETLLAVPPSAFKPAPKVDSVVVRLTPKEATLPVQDVKLWQQVVREGFSARRKTIKNALKRYLGPSDWQTLDLEPTKRPEELTVEDYVRISNYLRGQY